MQRTFHYAELKINRANRHIDEVQANISSFIDDNLSRVTPERDADGRFRIRFDPAPLPADIPLAIGDAFHAMNTSLDYVIWGILDAVGMASNSVHFPCNESRDFLRKSFMEARPNAANPDEYTKAGNNRKLMVAFPSIVDAILCKIEPHAGGRLGIWEIRKADTIDKHQLLIPAIYSIEFSMIEFRDTNSNRSMSASSITIPASGSRIIDLPIFDGKTAKIEIEYQNKPTLHVGFSESREVFPGQPVVAKLLQCLQSVKEAVEIIRGAVTAQNSGP